MAQVFIGNFNRRKAAFALLRWHRLCILKHRLISLKLLIFIRSGLSFVSLAAVEWHTRQISSFIVAKVAVDTTLLDLLLLSFGLFSRITGRFAGHLLVLRSGAIAILICESQLLA